MSEITQETKDELRRLASVARKQADELLLSNAPRDFRPVERAQLELGATASIHLIPLLDALAAAEADAREYANWRAGKIGVEEYYTLRESKARDIEPYLRRADELIAAYEAAAPKRWDCNICGGVVDLSNAVAPSISVGVGRPLSRRIEPGDHIWIDRFGLTCCETCGIVQRADGKNKPCKGTVRVGPRVAPKDPAHD